MNFGDFRAGLGYGWAIGLLVFFIMLVVFVLGMIGLHLLTRRSETKGAKKFENGMYSATNSQVFISFVLLLF
jgi:hypothetical protein